MIVQEMVKSSLGTELKEKKVLVPTLMQIKDDVG